MQLPDASLGSIIAAGIAGLVVFISTVLAKEQKTSEFRQVWIDELRKDISQYISGTSELVALVNEKKGDKEGQLKFVEDKFELIHDLQSVEHRIILRLNPKDHSALISQIKSFRDNMQKINLGADRKSAERALVDSLLDSTKQVLSMQWSRVKKGEPAFRIVKYLALLAILSFGAIAIRLFFYPSPALPAIQKSDSGVSGCTGVQVFH